MTTGELRPAYIEKFDLLYSYFRRRRDLLYFFRRSVIFHIYTPSCFGGWAQATPLG